MSISDAQYQTWLETPGNLRCALFELTFLGNSSGTPTEMHAYVSNMPYISADDDDIPTQIFEECVIDCPDFTMRMGEQLEGRTEQSSGALIISNELDWPRDEWVDLQTPPGGVRDSWLSMNWDGRRIRQWLGDPSWPMADFRVVLVGVQVDVFDQGGYKIGFNIGDKGALLDRPIMTATMADAGATDDAANGGLQPLLLGASVLNFKPKQLDNSSHLYLITAAGSNEVGTNNDNEDVREGGVSLRWTGPLVSANAGSDALEITDHGLVVDARLILVNLGGATAPAGLFFNQDYWVQSVIDVDHVKVAGTQGGAAIDLTGAGSGSILVKMYGYTIYNFVGSSRLVLAGNPINEITMRNAGLRTGPGAGTAVTTAGGIIEQVLTSDATNTPVSSADIDAASLAAFKALCTTPVGIWIGDQMSFADLLDKVVLSVGGWWGGTDDGLLEFGRLDLPSAGTPVYSFITDDVALRTLKLQRRILPRIAVTLLTDHNDLVQTNLPEGVGENDRALYGREWSQFVGSPTVTTWETDPAHHIRAARPEPYPTYIVGGGQQAEANRVATMFQYPTAIWSFDTHHVAFLLRRGSLIYFEHPKFTGYGTVVGVTRRVRGRSSVEFFAALPDVYPTADIE